MSKEQRKVDWSLDLGNMRARAGQFVTDMMGEGVDAQTASLHAPFDNADAAIINIEFAAGRATVKALDADSPNLFEAQLTYVGDYDFDVSGAAERVITLRQKDSLPRDFAAIVGNAQDLHWDISLAQDLPLRLNIKGGIGEADIDLSRLLIDSIKLNTGVGKVTLTLPQQDAPFHAEIQGGVGQTDVTVQGQSAGTLEIKGGVGQVNLLVSHQAAVSLSAKTALGHIQLPDSFVKVDASNSAFGGGKWKTEGFAHARKQFAIDYQGGVGKLELQCDEVL